MFESVKTMANGFLGNQEVENQQASNSTRVWNYTQSLLKGVGLVALGGMAYTLFRNFTATHDSTTDQNNALTTADENAEASLLQQSEAEHATLFKSRTQFDLPISKASLDKAEIEYRSKKSSLEQLFYLNEENNTRSIGVEFQINQNLSLAQYSPRVAALANNKFIVAWESRQEDPNDANVYTRVFDASGEAISNQNKVNTYTTNYQGLAQLATFNNSTVIVWQSYLQAGDNYEVYLQMLDEDGNKIGSEQRANTNTVAAQWHSVVTYLSNGNFVVAWSSNSGSSAFDIYYQLFNSQGNKVGAERRANTFTTNDQEYSAISRLGTGFIIVWTSSNQDGSTDGVFAQRFDVSGNTVGTEFQVNTYTPYDQHYPSVAELTNGNFVIVWRSPSPTYGFYAQLFNSAASRIGGEFLVNTYVVAGYPPAFYSSVAALPNGAFLIVWQSYLQDDGFSDGVYGQLFDSAAKKLGYEFQINLYTLYEQGYPSIAKLSNGNVVVVWQSISRGISGRILVPDTNLFALNANTTRNFVEDSTYGFTDLIVNPLLNATAINVTMTIDPLKGYLKTTTSTLNSAITSFNTSNGWWKVGGGVFDVNSMLMSQLQFEPVVNVNGLVAIQVSIQDGFHPDYQATVLLQGIPITKILNNTLILSQGDSVVLSDENLLARGENLSSDLIFTANNVLHGQFEYINNPNTSTTVFSQDDINTGKVKFVHDDSAAGPSYQVQVKVNASSRVTLPSFASINFNLKPVIVTNALNIANGKTKLLSKEDLQAIDVDSEWTALSFTVSNVTHGQFEYSNTPGTVITTFTQQDINDGKTQFVHDGSNQAPSYYITVSDGKASSKANLATINFIPNAKPILVVNSLVVESKGQVITLTKNNLHATDTDTDDTKLMFTVSNIIHGQFEEKSNPGVAITTFSQQDINDGKIQFAHDGSEVAPSYEVSVSDGIDFSTNEKASVTYSEQAVQDRTNTTIGIAVGVSAAGLLLASLGIFGAYRYKKSREYAAERCQYPLANALYEVLKIKGVENFKSTQGIAFINAVDALKNELKRAGIDVDQLVPEEITQLAQKLGKAIKAQVEYQVDCAGVKLNPTDIQDGALAIVDMAKMLKDSLKQEQDGVEMELINTNLYKQQELAYV